MEVQLPRVAQTVQAMPELQGGVGPSGNPETQIHIQLKTKFGLHCCSLTSPGHLTGLLQVSGSEAPAAPPEKRIS